MEISHKMNKENNAENINKSIKFKNSHTKDSHVKSILSNSLNSEN